MDLSRLRLIVVAAALALAAPVSGEEPAAPPELKNPGFESGLEGWTQGGWRVRDERVKFSVDATTYHGGSQAARIDHPQANDTHLLQTLTVKPDTLYKISAWIKTAHVKRIEYGEIGAALSILETPIVSDDLEGTQDWTYRELWVRTTDSPLQLPLACRLGHWSSTVTGTAWFDDVAIEAVPQAPAGATVHLYSFDKDAGLFHEKARGYWMAIVVLILAVVGLGWPIRPPRRSGAGRGRRQK